MGSHCAVLLLERHWINFRFSIAGYVLGLCHAVSSPLSKSCHFECVHQLGCNFSTTCSPYTRILLLFGFTVALLTVKYISLTFALSLVLLTNTSLAYLLLPELHFFFLWHLYPSTFILLCLLCIVEFYVYLLASSLFAKLFLCFTVTKVVKFILTIW